ncbi:DNA-3-methyladenine glycosylase [Methylobacillus gramineus]|uniref:DNA-3-methyladenine glycosylase family protein n=1 Tax=Methylobacillus gramineus TaxID=755169 RepID=UPI001CFF8D7B|nr:DNA-3-methyladenine glycosylase [Methylobacillus gramineus]MCB5184213.1 DNA-3-methyladenine glycosylase [Methylobacillus gramineus]
MHSHIQTSVPFEQATHFLAAVDSDWAELIDAAGPCLLQVQPEREPYEALVRAVAYQQLHTKAGDAILARLLNLYGGKFPPPSELLATEVDTLRACGFSGRKIATIHGIAQGVSDGIVPSRLQAEQMTNAALIHQLVQLKGIGQWTVEMLLMFALGREDILPVDDLGIREGYRRLKSLDVAPTSNAMKLLGEPWSPYRTVASWYLWRMPRNNI